MQGGLNWGDLISLAFLLFLAWTLIIMTGFLAVILARTVLVKSRFAGLLAVILFFVINFVIERVYDVMYKIPFIAAANNVGALGWTVWDVIYYIIVCLVLFGVSGQLAREKTECVSECDGMRRQQQPRRYPERIFLISVGSGAVNSIFSPVTG